MKEKVKFARRVLMNDFTHKMQDPKFHMRDFHATKMTVHELKRGIIRARKRAGRLDDNPEKFTMYQDQVLAYRARLVYYETQR